MELEVGKTYISRDRLYRAKVLYIISEGNTAIPGMRAITVRTNVHSNKETMCSFQASGNYFADSATNGNDLVAEYVPKEKVWVLKFIKGPLVSWSVATDAATYTHVIQTHQRLGWNLVKEQTVEV